MKNPSRTRLRASGKVLAIALPVMGIGALGALVAMPSSTSARLLEPPSLDGVADRSVIVGMEMAHLGLTPEALAGAGLSSHQVTQLIGLVDLDSDFGIDRYRAARVIHEQARSEQEDRIALIQAGLASDADITGLVDLRLSEAAMSSAADSAETALIALVESVITGAQSSALATIRMNAALDVPLPYAATDLTAQQRVDLREALAAKKYANRTGVRMDQDLSTFLSSLDARAEVIAAKSGLDDLSFIHAAFYDALDDLNN